MKEMLDHLEYTKLFLIISLGMIALTYLAHIISWNKRIVKYIPGLVSIAIGLYGFLTINSKIIFLDDINKLTIFFLGISVGLVGMLVAFILGIYNKDKVKLNKKNEKT